MSVDTTFGDNDEEDSNHGDFDDAKKGSKEKQSAHQSMKVGFNPDLQDGDKGELGGDLKVAGGYTERG